MQLDLSRSPIHPALYHARYAQTRKEGRHHHRRRIVRLTLSSLSLSRRSPLTTFACRALPPHSPLPYLSNIRRRIRILRHLRHSGIGLESALVFAGDGAHVVVADINKDAADRAVETIRAKVQDAPEAIAVKCDVSKESDIEELVKTAVQKFGRLDVMLSVLHLSFCRPLPTAPRSDQSLGSATAP